MEDQFFRPPIRQVKMPEIIITLSNTEVELNRGSDGLIHILLKPLALPGVALDYPWKETDLRVLLSTWLNSLREMDNGEPTSET
jgi:hypothetical protein